MEDDKSLVKHKTKLNAILITFVVVVLAVFFGIQLIMKTGIFHQPGKVIFADSTTEANRDFVNNLLTDELKLEQDVIIGASESTTQLDLSTTDSTLVLYDILLPVTNFYSAATNVTSAEAKSGTLVSVWDLNAEQKLLSLDGNYYLDSLTSGAFFQYFEISGLPQDVETIANLLKSNIAALPTSDTVLTLAQTGVTALSRRMNTKLTQVGDATYFAEQIADFLSSFDLTHTSNEASFSASANGANICAQPAMIDTLTAIGLDIVELTGNHNQDCGDQDAISTIDQYHALGIQTVGGGKTATEAAVPLEINQDNNHLTMLAYNLSTGGYTLDDTPGANFYTEEKAQTDIAAARQRGDFIIVDVQYYECNEYADPNENTTCDAANSSAGDQIGFFRHLIDLGANIVVGTAAHQPQTFELYRDGAIYYGLGNLFFDQSAWPGTTRSLILVDYFWQNQLLQTHIVPTIYDDNFQTRLMSDADAAVFLNRLIQARPAQP